MAYIVGEPYPANSVSGQWSLLKPRGSLSGLKGPAPGGAVPAPFTPHCSRICKWSPYSSAASIEGFGVARSFHDPNMIIFVRSAGVGGQRPRVGAMSDSYLYNPKHWHDRATDSRVKAELSWLRGESKDRLLKVAAEYDRIAAIAERMVAERGRE